MDAKHTVSTTLARSDVRYFLQMAVASTKSILYSSTFLPRDVCYYKLDHNA